MGSRRALGDVLAERVRRYRKQGGHRQDDIAERTDALGHRLSQPTLASIEAGGTRAANVTLRDVLVLAAALDVPPPLLFLPLGEDEEVEISSHFAVHPHVALDWLAGDDDVRSAVRWTGDDGSAWFDNSQPIRLFRGLRKRQDAVHAAQAALSLERQERIDPQHPDARDQAKAAVAAVLSFDGPADDFRRVDRALLDLAVWVDAMETTGMRAPEFPVAWRTRMAKLAAEG